MRPYASLLEKDHDHGGQRDERAERRDCRRGYGGSAGGLRRLHPGARLAACCASFGHVLPKLRARFGQGGGYTNQIKDVI